MKKHTMDNKIAYISDIWYYYYYELCQLHCPQCKSGKYYPCCEWNIEGTLRYKIGNGTILPLSEYKK